MIQNAATLFNLLGFITGAALYGMLLLMVLGGQSVSYAVRNRSTGPYLSTDRLPLITALLGLCWNIGGLIINGLPSLEFELTQSSISLLVAVTFTALGFLPAVVVHSVLRATGNLRSNKSSLFIAIIAYTLSTIASVFHFYSAIVLKTAPSHQALHILTFGFVGLIVVLLISTHGHPSRRAGWVVALAGFAVSAVHLSHHEGHNYAWWLELIGHHASLPLALAILYQDFRFALADIFLKRAFSLLLLVSVAAGLYVGVAAPFLRTSDVTEISPRGVGLLLSLWVTTALIYPWLRRGVNWFVDAIVLRRADYDKLRAEIITLTSDLEKPEEILDTVCKKLAPALTAVEVTWTSAQTTSNLIALTSHLDSPSGPLRARLRSSESSTGVLIPTAEAPQYLLTISGLEGGRQLLSDDIAMLEGIALLTARRIDSVRAVSERYDRSMREQEISKLATEAELRALRAQLNPHFFFNVLTTISYLIQTSPDRARDTLMRLTGLLRGVLRRSEGEFTTLGEEIDLIKDYLEIEHARFEERLGVRIDVPDEFRSLKVPSLILQPLVENAIKHGIAPLKIGGEVIVRAQLTGTAETGVRDDSVRTITSLKLSVSDTGAGVSEFDLAKGRSRGVGLSNVERRLKCHYGIDASIDISSTPGRGTIVEITLPVTGVHGSYGHLVDVTGSKSKSA